MCTLRSLFLINFGQNMFIGVVPLTNNEFQKEYPPPKKKIN